jgi:hypothetical protein
VFFNFDVPAEYMASYGRENADMMSIADLLLSKLLSRPVVDPIAHRHASPFVSAKEANRLSRLSTKIR